VVLGLEPGSNRGGRPVRPPVTLQIGLENGGEARKIPQPGTLAAAMGQLPELVLMELLIGLMSGIVWIPEFVAS